MIAGDHDSYEWIDNKYDKDSFMKKELGFGLRPIMISSFLYASFMRVLWEAPIEYAKVMGQIQHKWLFRDIYRGFGWQYARTIAFTFPIFATYELFDRATNITEDLVKNIILSGSFSILFYSICFPLETIKNLTQAGVPFPNATIKQKIDCLGGYKGLYRGVFPGLLSGVIRNSCGFLSIFYSHQLAQKLGI